MTKQDYEQMVEIIQDTLTVCSSQAEVDIVKFMVEGFATIAKRDNPRFNRDKFMGACGL